MAQTFYGRAKNTHMYDGENVLRKSESDFEGGKGGISTSIKL